MSYLKKFDLKKYRGVIFHGTEESCKIIRKNLASFHQNTLESLKISTLGSFIQSRKYMSLKFTGELCVMTMKNDAKFEEELTCQFKIDMRNLTNFDPITRESIKFAL